MKNFHSAFLLLFIIFNGCTYHSGPGVSDADESIEIREFASAPDPNAKAGDVFVSRETLSTADTELINSGKFTRFRYLVNLYSHQMDTLSRSSWVISTDSFYDRYSSHWDNDSLLFVNLLNSETSINQPMVFTTHKGKLSSVQSLK